MSVIRDNDALQTHSDLASAAGYALNSFIAEGSFKWCYVATSLDTGCNVAFKVLKPGGVISRAQRELAARESCNHDGIAKCLGYGSKTLLGIEHSYVLEEYFPKGSLEARIRKSPQTPAQVKELGIALISAVAYLKTKRLVHRDIKPANIMIREDGAPVLTDFGIVRSLGDASLTQSNAPFGLGTIGFMPAEQYANEKNMIDWRADQYALGITLLIAFMAQHPLGTTQQDVLETIAQRVAVPKSLIASCAAAGLPVLSKMISPWPVDRYHAPERLMKDWIGQMV